MNQDLIKAVKTLKDAGFIISLWTTKDVTSRFQISESDARSYLENFIGGDEYCSIVNEYIEEQMISELGIEEKDYENIFEYDDDF